jgi:hypothetical protein
MKFDKLNAMIPYVVGGKQKILTMHPYNAITLAMPGRHASDTLPKGGDFVVMVDDDEMDWTRHQFTHTDLFQDLQMKRDSWYASDYENLNIMFMEHYMAVVKDGYDPEKLFTDPFDDCPGIHAQTFFYAVQCLAVAEHRRYAKFEAQWGGRYLPFRFGAGIVQGLWTAADAAEKQKKGRPGVEWLEKDFGVPDLTKELMQ